MSPEFNSYLGRNRSTGKVGLSNPRAKRRLISELQGNVENVTSFSSDEAFRDLASVLRGVLALKKQKRASFSTQGMLPKPYHGVFNAKRRLTLESSQTFNQRQLRLPCLKVFDKTTLMNRRTFQLVGTVNNTSEEVGNRIPIPDSQNRSSVSGKERVIQQVSLGFDEIRVKAIDRTKITRNSQKFCNVLHDLVPMPKAQPSKENVGGSDDNAGKKCVVEISDQSSKNNRMSCKGLKKAPVNHFQELQLKFGYKPKFEGSCNNGKESFKGSVLEPMNGPLDGNLNKKLKFAGSYQNDKILLRGSVPEPLNEPSDENLNKELKFDGNCQNGKELLRGSALRLVNELLDESLKKDPTLEGTCQNGKELLMASFQRPLNEPWNGNLEKEPKFEGACENVKILLKGSVLRLANEPFNENAKKSGSDGGNKLGNEVPNQRFKKYSRISARKCRRKLFGKSSSVLHQGLDNQIINNDFLDSSKNIFQEHANESVEKKLKISSQYGSEQLGLCIDLNIENCKGNGAEECGREPFSQGVEMPCDILRERLHKKLSMNMNSKNLRDIDNNLVPKAAYVHFDEYTKEYCGVIIQKNRNEIVDCRFKKYGRGRIKKQRTEPATQVSITACAVLEGGLGSIPSIEETNVNSKDLHKNLVQHSVSESVDKKIYNEDRRMELASDDIGQASLKCSKNSTKENRAHLASEGFEKSCALLRDGFGNEPKIQYHASSVGPRGEIKLNSASPVSISHVTDNKEPYPDYVRPGSEECREIRDRLLELHGFPVEFMKYRARLKKVDASLAAQQQQITSLDEKNGTENLTSEASNKIVSCSETVPTLVPYEVHKTLLDSLISTLLSQNTMDVNSRQAFATLKKRFPTWDEVYEADPKAVEECIRCGGLAQIKTSRIKNILKSLLKERGKICLEYLHNMPIEKVKAELCRFKGVGPKTVACVLMFHLQHDDFPVDTHVFRITKSLGWVPQKANREKAYLHLNKRIPNDLKFDLNCLLVTHGKRCSSCSKRGDLQHAPDGACPILTIGVTAN